MDILPNFSEKWQTYFPILKKWKNLIYLDSAATSLKPKTVIKAINNYNEKYSINSHSESNNPLFKKVWQITKKIRELIAQKIRASSPEEIIFFPSSTYALNILALSLKNHLQVGDRILLTYLEHSSNLHPWQAIAQEKKATIEYLPLNKKFTIDVEKIADYVNSRTKIVSLFHVSNSLGAINPISDIAKKIKAINPHCLIILDACQSIIHVPIEAVEWNIDALVFSGHKAYGPTGIGALWIKKKLGQEIQHLFWGGGKLIGPDKSETKNIECLSLSQKFEVGTLPLAELFGLKAAFDFLNQLDDNEVYRHRNDLFNYSSQKLKEIKGIIIYNQNLVSTNIITFNLLPYHAHDVADYLGRKNVLLRAGNFCCPYLDKIIGTSSALRVSFGLHNSYADIDRLVVYLSEISQNPQLLLPF